MSETKVKSNNKLKIAVIVLAVAFIAAIGGIIGVYAATQQSVNTSFSVRYSIEDNVAVAIGACYVPASYNSQTWFTAEGFTQQDNNLYKVNANTTTTEFSLTGDDFDLFASCDEVRFYFENISDVAITVKFNDSSNIDENMNVQYVGDYRNDTSINDFISAGLVKMDTLYTIEPGQIYCIFLMLTVKDVNKSASYESTDDAGISFTIQQK